MNETAKMLMQKIYEAGFAVDDIVLYLDTHPDDMNALNYYHYAAQLRQEAVDAYQQQFGPLTTDGVKSDSKWTWLTEKWPWEGEA